jgi:hypothetical protein
LIDDRWILTTARCVSIPGWVSTILIWKFKIFLKICCYVIKGKRWGIWVFTWELTILRWRTKPIGDCTTDMKFTSIRNGIPPQWPEISPWLNSPLSLLTHVIITYCLYILLYSS